MRLATHRLPGLVVTDHMFTVPVDHDAPDGATIELFARELVTPTRERDELPWMVFFQGGPQLGELEAGLVANWLGPVVSVVTGGIGCLVATTWVAARTPALLGYRRPERSEPVKVA